MIHRLRPAWGPRWFTVLLGFTSSLSCGSPTAPGGTEQGVVQNGNIELRWFLDLPVGEDRFLP